LKHVDEVFRRRFAAFFVSVAPLEGAQELEEVDERTTEDERLRRLEVDDQVRAILARLSGRQLALLVGRYRDDKTLDQLARQYGCARGTVDNELKRATRQLREQLAGDEDYEAVLEKVLSASVSSQRKV